MLAVSITATFSIPGMGLVSDAQADTAQGVKVTYHSQEDIVNYVQKHPTGAMGLDSQGNVIENYSIEYAEKPELKPPYTIGQLTDKEEENALNMVKTIRYIAGLSDNVELSGEYIMLAQASSQINCVNGKLTHTPKIPDDMNIVIGAVGYQGSVLSNIAKYTRPDVSLKFAILDGFMTDGDKTNIKDVGHRRWILNPSMGATGFGSSTTKTTTYLAMYAQDMSNKDNDKDAIVWPAQNMPTSLFLPDSPWSVSLDDSIDIEDINISVIRESDSRVWVFNSEYADGELYVSNKDIGTDSCIIFRPEGITEYRPGDRFHVNISGFALGISYTVSFFDLENYFAPEAPYAISAYTDQDNHPMIEWKAVDGCNGYNLYRRAAGGSWKLLVSDIDEPYYKDDTAGKGIKYYYRITAQKDVKGTVYESEPSNEKAVSVSLDMVGITSAKAVSKKRNKITWNKVEKATGYKVYRREYGSAKWKLMWTTKNTYYINTKTVSGKKYQYRVRAYRTYLGNTVYGDYSSLKTVKTK